LFPGTTLFSGKQDIFCVELRTVAIVSLVRQRRLAAKNYSPSIFSDLLVALRFFTKKQEIIMKRTIMETLRSDATLKEKLNDEEVTKVICVILSLLFMLLMGTLGFKFINSLEAQAQQLAKEKEAAAKGS
jgi:hypothetical protein